MTGIVNRAKDRICLSHRTRQRPYFRLCGAMQLDIYAVESLACELVSIHGRRARQQVVDQMVEAIRNHDLTAAHFWDAVGGAVDKRLAERQAA